MAFNIFWVIGGVVGLMIILGVAYFWFASRNKGNKFKFVLHMPDGKTTRTIFAAIRDNPDHIGQREFWFKDFRQRIEFRPAERFEDNIATRDIAFDDKQEFTYIKIGDLVQGGKERKLDPEEKQIALHRYKESAKRYESALSKQQAYMFFGLIFLTIVVIVGLVAGVYFFTKSVKDSVEVAKTNKEVADRINAAVGILNEISAQQVSITGLLNNAVTGLESDDLVRPVG